VHIWSLKRLKADLLGPGLTDRQSLPYLIIVMIAVSAAFVAVPKHNFWSAVYGAVFVGAIILCTLLAYLCNGGSEGRDFLPRFLSVTTVCGVRWAVVFVLPLTILAVGIPGTPWALSFPGDPDRPPMGPYDVIMLGLLVPPLFWRVAVQMRNLRRSSSDPENSGPVSDHAGLEPLED